MAFTAVSWLRKPGKNGRFAGGRWCFYQPGESQQTTAWLLLSSCRRAAAARFLWLLRPL